jgi:hypothetical protein
MNEAQKPALSGENPPAPRSIQVNSYNQKGGNVAGEMTFNQNHHAANNPPPTAGTSECQNFRPKPKRKSRLKWILAGVLTLLASIFTVIVGPLVVEWVKIHYLESPKELTPAPASPTAAQPADSSSAPVTPATTQDTAMNNEKERPNIVINSTGQQGGYVAGEMHITQNNYGSTPIHFNESDKKFFDEYVNSYKPKNFVFKIIGPQDSDRLADEVRLFLSSRGYPFTREPRFRATRFLGEFPKGLQVAPPDASGEATIFIAPP